MKKIFAILAAAVVLAASCTKLGIPTIEFASLTGTFYAGTETTPVELKMNLAQEQDVTAKVRIVYRSTDLKDLATEEADVVFKAGETRAILNLKTDYRSSEEEPIAAVINVTLTSVPKGCVMGVKLLCVLAPATSEALVYSFKSIKGDLLESLNVKLELKGVASGSDYKATADFTIPAHIYGEGLDLVDCSPFFEVKAGEDFGTLTLKAKSGANDAFKSFVIEVEPSVAGYVAGEESEICVNVIGIPTAKTLATTWTFSEIVDADELKSWYDDMEDDFSACPINNKGFTLSIVEKDGALQLTPGTGDFANYYRTCTMTPCAPKNPAASTETMVLGSYSAQQNNMFISEVYGGYQQSIFYELSSANRSFDNSSESLGKGYISITFISKDEIVVTIHEYDEPPFAIMWWDDKKFDSDMLGFASKFVRTPGK